MTTDSIEDKAEFDTECDILADEAERDVALGSEHSLDIAEAASGAATTAPDVV